VFQCNVYAVHTTGVGVGAGEQLNEGTPSDVELSLEVGDKVQSTSSSHFFHCSLPGITMPLSRD